MRRPASSCRARSTPQGLQVLNADFESVTSGAVAQMMVVSGLGDQALYGSNPGIDQLLVARTGSYTVEAFASGVSPDVAEAQLEPLVRKAISGL